MDQVRQGYHVGQQVNKKLDDMGVDKVALAKNAGNAIMQGASLVGPLVA